MKLTIHGVDRTLGEGEGYCVAYFDYDEVPGETSYTKIDHLETQFGDRGGCVFECRDSGGLLRMFAVEYRNVHWLKVSAKEAITNSINNGFPVVGSDELIAGSMIEAGVFGSRSEEMVTEMGDPQPVYIEAVKLARAP